MENRCSAPGIQGVTFLVSKSDKYLHVSLWRNTTTLRRRCKQDLSLADVNQDEDCLGQHLNEAESMSKFDRGHGSSPHRVINVWQTEAQRISTCMDMDIRQSLI